jgi:transcriptional regulator with XRE-family HTH domain
METTTTAPTGSERLAQWIERGKLSQVEAARIIGIDKTQLSQILNDKRRPGLDNAVRIERATGISVEAWVPTPVDETAASYSVVAQKSKAGKA